MDAWEHLRSRFGARTPPHVTGIARTSHQPKAPSLSVLSVEWLETWADPLRGLSLERFGARLELFEKGASKRLLERRPDRHWIRSADAFALSASGSTLALLDGPRSMTAETGHNLCVYDGDGTARFTLPLPEPFRLYRIATSDRWAVVTSFEHDALLVNLESKRIVQLELEASEHSWRWGFSPDGKELWAVDIPSLLLERYALPLEPSEPDRK